MIQYPGIFITYTPNEAPKKAQPPYGYVYVDNYQLTKSEFDSGLAASSDKDAYKLENIWRVVHYSSGGTDMYKITTTVLPSGSDFIIGDPRENVIDNLRNGNSDDSDDFRNAPCVSVNPQTGKMELEKQGDNNKLRSLTCYYPTDPSDRTVNMIAPSYQISTKFSGSEYDGVPIEQARYRCAAFQENGFPAGRWRLPTKGEIKFAAQLSANGVFEWQFGGNYWSANGAVHVDKSSGEVRDAVSSELTDGKRALVRCVYDTWYWGDERVLVNSSGAIDPDGKPTLFVWADAAR